MDTIVSPERLKDIRRNRDLHVSKLREIWNKSMLSNATRDPGSALARVRSLSRSKYNPNDCDRRSSL